MTLDEIAKNDVGVRAKLDRVVQYFASDPEVLELVKNIESGVPTTKDNYARYMAILVPCLRKGRPLFYIMACALKKAGANPSGVDWAVRLLTGGI